MNNQRLKWLGWSIAIGTLLNGTLALAQQKPPECQTQKVQNSVAEMCYYRQGALLHDVYTLKVDHILVFSIVDDFIEQVSLSRKMYRGESLEFTLSNQGLQTVQVNGGCRPVIQNGITIARVCNFKWGKIPVVKNIRFNTKA